MKIMDGLNTNWGVAIVRANDRGFLYMNSEAIEMFRFRSFEEASTCLRRSLFTARNTNERFPKKQATNGVVVNERVLFSRRDRSNFWGSITSRLYCVKGDVRHDEIIVDISDNEVNEHMPCEESNLLKKVGNELDRFILRTVGTTCPSPRLASGYQVTIRFIDRSQESICSRQSEQVA